MITVEEARQLLMDHVPLLGAGTVHLPDALGSYSAADVQAPYDHPLFTNSAVDGYAFAFGTLGEGLKMIGTVPAGRAFPGTVRAGECVRIFTGALLPPGTDTVVMQENVHVGPEGMIVLDKALREGANVREQGAQFRAGDVILPAGHRITPEAIGLLASAGVKRIKASARPVVAVVITGSEFTSGTEAQEGRIFSSNDHMLQAALAQEGLEAKVVHAPDEKEALRRVLRTALAEYDLVITTGGVSVGDHDLVPVVLQELDVRIHLHRVAQKPGKPMLFGRLGEVPVLGLPGNPRAVMVLFWEYVLPFLRAMQGAAATGPRMEHLPIAMPVTIKGERTEFRAATVRNGRVLLLPEEGSHMLRTLLMADALALLPHDRTVFEAGDAVEVHYLPR